MTTFTIRDARPSDRAHFLAYIMGSQRFEKTFEPNRRLDAPVASEYFALVEKDVAEGGKIFVAEQGGAPVGWGIVLEREDDVYVLAEERRHAYISELFVVEAMRGAGIGRALIVACEDWAREHRLRVMQIGVLPGNLRAKAIYENAGYNHYALQLRKYLKD
jgi:ribosomal protein S18 acetylase RimI-like enzyme